MFDPVAASRYTPATNSLSQVINIMGQYQNIYYLDAPLCECQYSWAVGNKVNGEWAGSIDVHVLGLGI